MVIFMLSLTGIPMTAGFVGKFFIFQAAVAVAETNPIFFAMIIVGALTTAVSAYYYVRVIIAMYFQDGESEAVTQPALQGAIALTAAATVILGVLPAAVVRFAEGATIAFLGG
jgi:NADH-quinone oxidoreductase subunit N